MKRALYLALWVLVLVPPVANAAPLCMSNVGYDTYVRLGAGGCQLDDKLFFNFTYSGSGSGGAVPIPSSGITVTAFDVAFFPGFQFQAPWTAGPGQTLDSLIQFDVVVLPGGAPISDIHASMGGIGHLGDGLVLVAENVTGAFTGDLLLYDYSGGVRTADTLFVIPPTMGPLHVVKDISLNGNSGLATVSQVENRFSEIPEPATFLLLGTGLLGVRRVARRLKRS